MRSVPGMNTIHGQAKDRRNWKQSIRYRQELIDKAISLNIKLQNPHSMKIRQLEELVNRHLGL